MGPLDTYEAFQGLSIFSQNCMSCVITCQIMHIKMPEDTTVAWMARLLGEPPLGGKQAECSEQQENLLEFRMLAG